MHGTLLLALTVALSIGVPAPAAAGAEVKFTAPPGAALEATRAGPDVFAAGGIEKECKGVELRGTLLDDSRALELAPLYGKCLAKSLNGLPVKLVWWSCGYVLHPIGRRGHRGTWRARVSIACPSSHVLEWNVYESEEKYAAGNPMCVTEMPPQYTAGFAELSNVGGSPGEIGVRWHLSGIAYEAHGSDLLCGLTPGISKSDASYTGHAVVGATDLAGNRLDFALSD